MILIVSFLWTLILIVFCPVHGPWMESSVYYVLKLVIVIRTFFFL